MIMRLVLAIFKTIFILSLLLLLHFFTVFFLPFPLNTINIFYIFFILYIIGWERGLIIWLSFLVFYVFELYSIAPFGFIIYPGLISVVAVYIFYMNVFTNRSWYTSIALSLIGVATNRIIYLFLIYIINYSSGISKIVLRNFFVDIFWELLLTACTTGIIFLILSKNFDRFSRDRVNILL